MSNEFKQGLVAGFIVLLSVTGFVLVSIVVRQTHDAEVRQQVIETCKEFK